MIYMLDTDTLISMLRGLKPRQRPAPRRRAERLVQRCRETRAAGDSVALSAVTVSELEFGARNSGRYDTEITAVHKILTPFDIHDYDGVAAPSEYGRIRHDLEREGLAIGSMDLLIAAHALAIDATLVTSNLSHFSRVAELRVMDWAAA